MPVYVKGTADVRPGEGEEIAIEEFVGRVASGTVAISVARARTAEGWLEPARVAEFDEYLVVLNGTVRVESEEGTFDVHPGSSIIVRKGEWARYSTPYGGGAEYIAVCTPAYSSESVHAASSAAESGLSDVHSSMH